MKPLTKLAHEIVARKLEPGGIAIDATVGNGHDTIFLAETVGPAGVVYGFDIQMIAIEATHKRCHELGLTNIQLWPASHERMLEFLPARISDNVAAIMFNLGYLPGGDKSLTTMAESSVFAIEQGLKLFSPQGVLTILAYPGHATGALELAAVEELLSRISGTCQVSTILGENHRATSPRLFVVQRAEATL